MNKSFILRVSIVAAIGGLLFGYDTAVIAGVVGYLQTRFHLSSIMVGWAASSAIWGCVIGAMLAGYLSDRMGRKKVLIITAVLFFISSIAAAFAQDLTQFILARLIGGLGIGAASMLSPLYISEIAPAKSRGRLVSLYQLAIVLGINLIYFVNLRIAAMGDEAWNVDRGWRYMLASGMLPAVLFLVLLLFVPESPRWLTAKGRKDEAMDILKKVNGEEVASVVHKEIVDALGHETGTLKELFRPGLRMAMLVGVFLAFFCQITGINAIIYYAPEIFKNAGFGTESAFTQTVIIGVVNTLFTFLAIWLIDKAGRRALLLWGVTGMIVCLFAVAFCYHYHIGGFWLLICILGYIACFASSLGPVPWVIMAEIFPTRSRGVAMSFATVVLWVGVLLITQLTPVMLDKLKGTKTFLLFMVNAIILLVFTWKRIPETRQRTLEDIEKSWTR
jgi:SP family arabinose:H+ symporter-like MFS transporter